MHAKTYGVIIKKTTVWNCNTFIC